MSSQSIIKEFMQKNNLDFVDINVIKTALTHPSYTQEYNNNNNQRLEFLGDAVLNFIVAEYLYTRFSDKPEGDLTKIRARVVSEKALNNFAKQINIGAYLLLGKGEEMSGGRKRKSILADAVEAVIGGIYLDQGMEKTRKFIIDNIEHFIIETANGNYQDYKSKLQELVQSKGQDNVNYKIIKETGPAHAKSFVAGVYYQNRLLAYGDGKSKKEAEQNAAENLLKNNELLEEIG
ncbi:Ribonuclease III [Candidatus Syntrophocurvum alkaliphilum]|uniref:Ribonuclease 3 n=1 Tax=Candidatus Syntrophocurvum alkaliphilum TaxID=2293317 RepID=A0A6I6DF07_9FIRM|nr:ribonuclease III [Candidatus Syntrophocurvum alkaliphilum]QGT99088.1 Ribonuclease III [Candidatus Syntrophocurvum alkaliphilum]